MCFAVRGMFFGTQDTLIGEELQFRKKTSCTSCLKEATQIAMRTEEAQTRRESFI